MTAPVVPIRRGTMSRYASKLTDAHRIYVIQRLAARHSPTSVVLGLRQEFGIAVSRPAVNHYDPERVPRAALARRWKDLFWKEREAYEARTAHLGVTDKAARIRQREAMMHREWAAGRHAAANEILDSIARELGASYGQRKRRR
jgi:hypothetical protein